jgi:2-C-methyl-D-erythritol 4-phosphate cytidylyltransferase
LVTSELIEQGVALAARTGAALCAIPARDTVKLAEGDPPLVRSTLERGTLWLAQTPQCFERSLIIEAHRTAEAVATDDAALVEALGKPVAIYPGSPSNIKVTTAEDLVVADVLLRERFARN